MTAVVIALGDEFRGDDGVGPAMARALHRAGLPARILVSSGDPVELIEWWRDARVAVILDAVMRPDPRPGRVHVLDPSDLQVTVAGTHGFDLGAAIALGRALDRMPDRLVIIGVEIADLSPGHGLSPAVAAAASEVARAVTDALSGEHGMCTSCPGPAVLTDGDASGATQISETYCGTASPRQATASIGADHRTGASSPGSSMFPP